MYVNLIGTSDSVSDEVTKIIRAEYCKVVDDKLCR